MTPMVMTQPEAIIHFRGENFQQRREREHAHRRGDGARHEHEAGLGRGELQDRLREDGHDEDGAVKAHADGERDDAARGQRAMAQHAQIDRRMLRVQFLPDERGHADDAQRRHALDEGGGPPVVLLALLQHGLEGAEAEREEKDALPIDAAVFARRGFVLPAKRWRPSIRRGCRAGC